MWERWWNQCIGYDYTADMDGMDLAVHCLRKAVKFSHSLTYCQLLSGADQFHIISLKNYGFKLHMVIYTSCSLCKRSVYFEDHDDIAYSTATTNVIYDYQINILNYRYLAVLFQAPGCLCDIWGFGWTTCIMIYFGFLSHWGWEKVVASLQTCSTSLCDMIIVVFHWNGQISNPSALVEMMARDWTFENQLSEPMVA